MASKQAGSLHLSTYTCMKQHQLITGSANRNLFGCMKWYFGKKKINENLGNKTCFHCSTDSDKVYCVCSIMQKDQKQKEQPWRCIASHSVGSVAQREKPGSLTLCAPSAASESCNHMSLCAEPLGGKEERMNSFFIFQQ